MLRKRPVLFASLAVILVGAAGATSVFLLGSKQRRDDRNAYLAYERTVLVPLAEVGRVAGEIRAVPMRLRDGSTSGEDVLRRVDVWTATLLGMRAAVRALEPPGFIGVVENRWVAAIDGYLRCAASIAGAARAAGAERIAATGTAENILEDADRLYGGGSESMHFHRRRLGLQATPRLPDPAATRTS